MATLEQSAERARMVAVQQTSNVVFARLAEAIRSTPLGVTLSVIRFGIDICSVPQMREAIADAGFTERFFTGRERLHCARSAARFAANFAAKEAVIKAFQRWPKWLMEIEILHEVSGAPYVNLTGSAQTMREALSIEHLVVSASHEGDFAIAGCLAFGRSNYHVT